MGCLNQVVAGCAQLQIKWLQASLAAETTLASSFRAEKYWCMTVCHVSLERPLLTGPDHCCILL